MTAKPQLALWSHFFGYDNLTDDFTKLTADVPPAIDSGWSREVVTVQNAVIHPPLESAMVQEAGVISKAGEYVAHGATWRGWRPITTEPINPVAATQNLKGRWLFGGLLWVHFGHFLAESTSRLWALDMLKDLDGIVFYPKRPKVGETTIPFQTDFLRLSGCNLPMHVATEPTNVETLFVPGQGFGLGHLSQGTEEYRQFFHQNFGKSIAPDGPERLYLSRSGLGPKRGGIVGEEYVEQNLIAHGYEIFHPQQHSMETQIARYKAAKKIVSLDGSALHLFALVGRPEQDVAMILRRTSGVYKNIESQLTSFCEKKPVVIDAIESDWLLEGSNRPDRQSVGSLNHTILVKALAENGFIDTVEGWSGMPWRQRNRAIRNLSKKRGIPYNEVPRVRADGS